LILYTVLHSRLAELRTYVEPIVSASWPTRFAVVSLPLALACLSCVINHAHKGMQ